ncbi:hypothetical protein GW17_00011099 [Ensete ventricosum]|nr:hypothetical protein GW17_00011099 [Ensete ventricosum]
MMKLAHRMVMDFCASFSASAGNKWTMLSGINDDLRVTLQRTDSSLPHGVVLSAATSIWLPLPRDRVFGFLKDEQNRPQVALQLHIGCGRRSFNQLRSNGKAFGLPGYCCIPNADEQLSRSMETTSSEDEESLKDNNVDLNDDNIEHHIAFDVGNQLADAGNLFSSHQQNSENSEPFVGMEFESEESAKLFYMAYASRVGFSVRISKSRRSRNDESIIMRRFVCSKEGFHLRKGKFDDGKKKRKRATIREGCNAMIEVIQKYYGRWVVTKLVKEHNHVVAAPSRVLYVAPEAYGNADPYLGMEFPSHEAAQTFYYAYASRVGFDVRIRLSRRSTRDETFVMRRFVCTKEGFTPHEDSYDESKKKRNRTPTREDAKNGFVLDECVRYNELYRDAVKYAKEGSTSEEVYTVAKNALQIGFAQVLAAKKSIVSQCTM